MSEQGDRPRTWRQIGRIALGGIFVVLGVAGLFLPFLQGILFLAIGGTLLAPDIPFVRRAFVAAYRRYPRLRRLVPRRYRRLGSVTAGENGESLETSTQPGPHRVERRERVLAAPGDDARP